MEPLKVSGSGGIPMKTRLNIILEKSINKILIILGLLLTASTVITITLTVEYIRVENVIATLPKMEAEVAKYNSGTTNTANEDNSYTNQNQINAPHPSKPDSVSRTTHPTNPSCWREEKKCQNITAKWSNCFGTSLPVRVNCTVLRELCDEQPGNHTTVQVSRRCTCIYALNWDCSYA
uniref:Small hydrophobic protein n=1 Tax=avian metapneumovirus TaxID=38525 RepID=Q80AG1_9MONO|nr:small hydrophobic protein [Avian metapneumovirus]